jgi:hypothetical protein
MEEAVNTLVSLSEVQEVNAKKTKEISGRIDKAKAQLLEYLITNKKDFVQVGPDVYVRLKQKKSKPALDADFLSASFYKYTSALDISQGITLEHGVAFAEYVCKLRDGMQTCTRDVHVTKQRPVSATIMGL